jgi:hypothetical protein
MNGTRSTPMEVQYAYTRDDWVCIDMHVYKNWLYSQRALSTPEYWTCWFLLLFSLLAGVGCLVFLGVSIWLGLAWYFVVGPVVPLVFFCGMALEVLRPRREPVRGLLLELGFRLGWETKLIEKVNRQRALHFRRLEEKGRLNLGHRYALHIDPAGYTLVTDFPRPPAPRRARKPDGSGARYPPSTWMTCCCASRSATRATTSSRAPPSPTTRLSGVLQGRPKSIG